MSDASAVLLELVDVTRRFPGVLALDRVSFSLAAGEVHALVGENGAGKSTLINLIAGLFPPDSGTIRLAGREVAWANPLAARRAGIVVVHQEAELFPTLSVAENMTLEQGLLGNRAGWIDWRRIRAEAQHATAAMGDPIDVEQEAEHLSVAQRHLTQISAAIDHRSRVLVLDEPTSALTHEECEWLFAKIAELKALGVGIVYISHRQDEIFRLADHITVLRDGQAVWSGPAAKIDRAGLIRQMVGREAVSQPVASRRADAAQATEPPRLQVDRLCDARGRVTNVSLRVQAGEVVGIYGLIGSGRTEFARALFGLDARQGGDITIDGMRRDIRGPGDAVAAGLAYLPEDRLRQGIFRGLSVRANTVIDALDRLGRGPLASARQERLATQQQITSLGVKCRGTEQPLGQLSGGNQQKIVLGRWLLTEPAVLILDEPTRGVDVNAKAEIHRLVRQLADRGTAVILISSELNEVLEHADRIVVFRSGRLAAEFQPEQATPEAIAQAALPLESHSPDTAALGRRSQARRRAWRSELTLAAAIVLTVLMLSFSNDRFLTHDNLVGLLSNASVSTILALGAAMVIMAGAIDISCGALLALASGVAGLVLKLPYPAGIVIPSAIAAGLAVGAAGGMLNAALALVGRIHPIVVTLGTLTIYRGLLISLTGGVTITDLPRAFVRWSTANLGGLNGSILLCLATAVAAHVWLGYFRGGRHLLAVGASESAARLAGISRARAWLIAFGLGGCLAALAGLLELSQTGAMQSGMGTAYELQAITAAVIGGVAISGGRGSVVGVCLGALLLSLIHNALVIWQVSGHHYALVTGGLLLTAVIADAARGRIARRSTR